MKQWKGLRLAALLACVILASASLAGCQTSQMKEAQADGQTDTADSKKEDAGEDEYIDADSVEDTQDGDGDLDKYKSGKKSKSSQNKGSGKGAKETSGQSEGKGTSGGGETGGQNQNPGASVENAASGQEAYNTDPVPEGMPEPVEPEDSAVDFDQSLTCTLYVECSNILNNMDDLAEGKESLVPADGVIYGPTAVTFYEGESVYDVLLREMQNNRIHMEAEFTPANNSSYIKAVNNLYERDCGSLSGWRYCVNGWYPNYGCSRYQVQNGDTVELHYTCDLGRDLDGDVPEGNS